MRCLVSAAAATLRRCRTFSACANPMALIRFRAEDGSIMYGEPTDSSMQAAKVVKGLLDVQWTGETARVSQLLAPVDPPVVWALGLNYAKHAAEAQLAPPKYPVVILKPPTAVTAPHGAICIPKCAADPPEVDYEVELAVVIGRACKDVLPEDALQYVLGYTVANDVTARRWQGKKGGGQWVRSKGFDTFLPLGPALALAHTIPNPNNLLLESRLNDVVMQRANTSEMIFSVPELISFLSQGTTLLPGTVILTGTPEGVGYSRKPPVYLQPGDCIVSSIEGIGDLLNTVQSA